MNVSVKPKYYLRNPELIVGGELRCWNCKKMLAKRLVGSVYELELECQRCHATIRIRCKEPIEFVGEQMIAERSRSTSENGAQVP